MRASVVNAGRPNQQYCDSFHGIAWKQIRNCPIPRQELYYCGVVVEIGGHQTSVVMALLGICSTPFRELSYCDGR